MKLDVFLTDKTLRTRSTVDEESHWGPSIKIQLGDDYDYRVKVETLSNFDPRNPDDCKDYNDADFEICVDEELQYLWKPVLGCNPPWLSPKDQCTDFINATKDIVKNIYSNNKFSVISGIVRMESYPAREKCTKPCTVTQSNSFLKEKTLDNGERTNLKFRFAKQVIYKTKILGYGFSNFLIDLGSSLGLWFGLSVFGITDLGIMTYQWAKLNSSTKFCK